MKPLANLSGSSNLADFSALSVMADMSKIEPLLTGEDILGKRLISPVNIVDDTEQIAIFVKYGFVAFLGCY